jgi:hypothetical protein
MINAIDTGLRRIKENIPGRILQAVFKGGISVEANIRKNVIYDTVIPDCNLKGGKVLQILLRQEYAVPMEQDAWGLYQIPYDAREGRNIIEVHGLSYKLDFANVLHHDSGTEMMYNDHHVNDFMQHNPSMIYAASAMLQSKTGVGMRTLEPIPEVVGGNMIRLHPSPMVYNPWTLTCRVCYDNEMTNLNSAAIDRFATVCEYATKRYCYNRIIIDIDSAAIEFGSELPVIKDIVGQWADMRTLYTEASIAFSTSTKLDMRRFESLARSAM